MFHPSSNRLAGFLEISALSISLAQAGTQYKAGFLQIESINNGGGGFGRKSVGWGTRKDTRWCAIRESYLVVMEDPGEVGPVICFFGQRAHAYHLVARCVGYLPSRHELCHRAAEAILPPGPQSAAFRYVK